MSTENPEEIAVPQVSEEGVEILPTVEAAAEQIELPTVVEGEEALPSFDAAAAEQENAEKIEELTATIKAELGGEKMSKEDFIQSAAKEQQKKNYENLPTVDAVPDETTWEQHQKDTENNEEAVRGQKFELNRQLEAYDTALENLDWDKLDPNNPEVREKIDKLAQYAHSGANAKLALFAGGAVGGASAVLGTLGALFGTAIASGEALPVIAGGAAAVGVAYIARKAITKVNEWRKQRALPDAYMQPN